VDDPVPGVGNHLLRELDPLALTILSQIYIIYVIDIMGDNLINFIRSTSLDLLDRGLLLHVLVEGDLQAPQLGELLFQL